jgi:hypothetical protein
MPIFDTRKQGISLWGYTCFIALYAPNAIPCAPKITIGEVSFFSDIFTSPFKSLYEKAPII